MDFLTITAVDMHSSDSTSRTFDANDIGEFKEAVLEWESELDYGRYELVTEEFIEDDGIIEALEELEVEI